MKLTINGQDMSHLFVKDDALLVMLFGDLLDLLEMDHIRAGQCITHVVIDGKEETSCRDFATQHRLLKNINEIAITTGDFDTVVRESLTELNQKLVAAIRSVSEIIRDFENQHKELAYDKLEVFLDGIKIFAALFAEDLGWSFGDTLETTGLKENLEHALEQLVAAQESDFWVNICDILEFEIQPILENWQKIVQATIANLPAPTPLTL